MAGVKQPRPLACLDFLETAPSVLSCVGEKRLQRLGPSGRVVAHQQQSPPVFVEAVEDQSAHLHEFVIG